MGPTELELAGAGLPDPDRTAWVEVDTAHLIYNARILSNLVHPRQLGVGVRADGYGHGLEIPARYAVQGDATWLCVATPHRDPGRGFGQVVADGRRLRRDDACSRPLGFSPQT